MLDKVLGKLNEAFKVEGVRFKEEFTFSASDVAKILAARGNEAKSKTDVLKALSSFVQMSVEASRSDLEDVDEEE